LEKAEQEGKRLRGENDQLRTSIASFKADVKEAFEARDQKEKENTRLHSELTSLKVEKTEEITKLEGENARLRGKLNRRNLRLF
jgi:cell shape-determining protein MreC